MIGRHVTTLLLTAGAGFVLAVFYIASPLTLWALTAAPVVGWLVSRHLPQDQRRLLLALLGAAFTARLLLVGGQFLAGLPHHNDLGVGALSGDESYYLTRALRTRDLVLGLTATQYDYFVANDAYGRTSYLTLLTWLQVIFGPTPYSMRIVNALLFVTGASLLFRVARTSFGSVPAFLGLGILLFLPSLFVASVSLLKESLYFLVASTLTVSSIWAIRSARSGPWGQLAAAIVVAAASLWLLDDLRRGAVILAAAGLALAAVLRGVAVSRRRLLATATIAAITLTGALTQPAIQERVLPGISSLAKMHAGHVFTVGHSYKLMDEGFYKNPEAPMAWDLRLSGPQAARFLVRGLLSFAATPLPWQMRSLSELAFMPEHLLWYVLLAMLPLGVVVGWRHDPWATCVLVGLAVPAAVALALTTGNVGTLLRFRGLVTPYFVWLSALGLCAAAEWLLARRAARLNTRVAGMRFSGEPS